MKFQHDSNFQFTSNFWTFCPFAFCRLFTRHPEQYLFINDATIANQSKLLSANDVIQCLPINVTSDISCHTKDQLVCKASPCLWMTVIRSHRSVYATHGIFEVMGFSFLTPLTIPQHKDLSKSQIYARRY